MLQGVKKWKNSNGFFVYRLHYSADPFKRTPEWKERESQGLPKNDWNREYEIDFSSFTGRPVFLHDFDENRMVVPLEASPKFPLIRSWDFGYHHPAVVWGQVFDGVQFRCLESDMGEDVDFRIYARHIFHLSALLFPGRVFLDCCDIAGKQKHATGDEEIKILTNEFGIVPRRKKFSVKTTLDQMRMLMNGTYKGMPRFLVNGSPGEAKNKLLIDALKGGYHYPEKIEGRPEPEEPFQDRFYENIVDPVRYAVMHFLGIEKGQLEELHKICFEGIPEPKPDLW